MELTAGVKLHNKFDIEVRDAKTGKLKQRAYAYNVITNAYFSHMLTPVSSSRQNPFTGMYIGSGTGTPAITDTALFHNEITKGFNSDRTVIGYPTSQRIMTAKIESTECNGKNLTEVGLYHYYPSTGSGTDSHAMIKDSEGNQITIAKTDTDVVYITATFYCTVTNSGFGDNAVYPAAGVSSLASYFLNGTFFETVYGSKRAFQYANEISSKYTKSKSYSLSDAVGNLTNLTLTLPTITVLDSEWNNKTIKSFGFPGIGLFQFPDSSAFSDYSIDHTNIGTGDGTTTEFSIKCPHIKQGTVKIYVNSEEVPSTDYEIDYDSNCCDQVENYYTAEMSCFDNANVSFGNLSSMGSGTSTIFDPFQYGGANSWKKTSKADSYVYISQANPIWIDFGTAKECNRMRVFNQSSAVSGMVIQYSDDNENWTTLTATLTSGKYSFDLTSARYWRAYPSSGSYIYLNTQKAVDDVTTCACFFLGRSVPGLKFNTAPAADATIEASYKIDVPYKTSNNLLRINCTIQLQRG